MQLVSSEPPQLAPEIAVPALVVMRHPMVVTVPLIITRSIWVVSSLLGSNFSKTKAP
jgi:hypothetical protein